MSSSGTSHTTAPNNSGRCTMHAPTSRPPLLPPLIPSCAAVVTPSSRLLVAVTAVSLVALAVLGAVAARTGGAKMLPGIVRVLFWGALAMAVTAGLGTLFGAVA